MIDTKQANQTAEPASEGDGVDGKVDQLITAVPGAWEFNEEVVDSFDDHVRRSVPLYDEIQRMVVEMSEWFVGDDSTVYDLGSATGETIALLHRKHEAKRNIRFVGVDNSLAMVRAARQKCIAPNTDFVHQDVASVARFTGADYIVSLFTIQFVPTGQRRKLLRQIYEDLSEGGALVVVEKVITENASLENVWQQLHWDLKKASGLTDDMILQKARSLRGVLVPLSLSQNLTLLREVGFSEVETFFKWFGWAGFIAVKGFGKQPLPLRATVNPAFEN